MSMRLKLLLACILTLTAGGMLHAADRVDVPNLQSPSSLSVTPVDNIDLSPGAPAAALVKSADLRANYNCWLRVYIVEPESRWADNTSYYHYEFGFLDFGIDTALSIPYLGSYETTRSWTCPIGLVSIDSSNIMVMAVLFNQEDGGTNYSDPPTGSPFTIHTSDAAASAIPGVPGYDTAYGGNTHTVFVEEATATT
jgi:hypothetical protein